MNFHIFRDNSHQVPAIFGVTTRISHAKNAKKANVDAKKHPSALVAVFASFALTNTPVAAAIVSFFVALAFVLFLDTASALDYVQFKHHGKERSEEGRIVFEEPGGFLLEARDGQQYIIKKSDIISRRSDDVPFVRYTNAEMIERLQEEFPPNNGYNLDTRNDHFMIVYTTSKPFATWYGNLMQKVHEHYVLHWKRLGVELTPPEFPMIVVVLSHKGDFRDYAKQDKVALADDMCAYYHRLTNRIIVYDMTGQQAQREEDRRRLTSGEISREMRTFLRQPNSDNNIRTIVHEAVHQIGFNTGMHPRTAPIPVWLCEGLALFHEVPNPNIARVTIATNAWTPGPHVNHYRLAQLRKYLDKKHRESPFRLMIQRGEGKSGDMKGDMLFRHTETALDNYALAWGLTYYLVKKRPKELAAYLAMMQNKTHESEDTDEIRIKEFEKYFGSDWEQFHKDFSVFLQRL